jgi:cardiolipin synthase A/B
MRPTIKNLIAFGAVIGSVLAVSIWGVATTAAAGAQSSSGAVYYRLVQYPKAGFGGFYSQIAAAKHTIDMEMYELSDPTAEHDLAQAAARGVNVRVLLDRDYSGGEVNASAYSYLASHGVKVRWAPSHYIFHIKATTFDGRTADISTANLTAAYYTDTRDAEVIDTNPAQVKAIERTFAGDWKNAPGGYPRNQTTQAAGLVWSPNTGDGSAEAAVVAQIYAARHVIDVESEELSDQAVYAALAADARRGVNCRIVMTSSSEWRTAYSAVTRAGCKVHVFPDSAKSLYIHEKLILDDPGTSHQSLLIGSQNAGWESLHVNRELSVLISGAHGGAAVIKQVGSTFESDFSQAQAWKS